MTHASLFSGIGGFDLAAEQLNWKNIFHCDINDFCLSFLKARFENESYKDITKTDFLRWRGKIDVLSGGFPCQDISIANQLSTGQTGLSGMRSGLWREMARAIYEIRPKFVVAENVGNILRINDGKDFDQIISTFSRLGYDVEWKIVYASDVGAPHKRKRCYMVAYSRDIRLQEGKSFFSHVDAQKSSTKVRRHIAGTTCLVGTSWLTEPSVCSLAYGFSPDVFRHHAKTKLVKEFFQAYGNAIIPQIALEIFWAINDFLREDSASLQM